MHRSAVSTPVDAGLRHWKLLLGVALWSVESIARLRLFLPDSDPPSLFRAGDRVKFFAAGQ